MYTWTGPFQYEGVCISHDMYHRDTRLSWRNSCSCFLWCVLMASLWSSAFHQGMLYSNVGKKMVEKGVFAHWSWFFLKFFCVFCVILPVLFFFVCKEWGIFMSYRRLFNSSNLARAHEISPCLCWFVFSIVYVCSVSCTCTSSSEWHYWSVNLHHTYAYW